MTKHVSRILPKQVNKYKANLTNKLASLIRRFWDVLLCLLTVNDRIECTAL